MHLIGQGRTRISLNFPEILLRAELRESVAYCPGGQVVAVHAQTLTRSGRATF
jgi:hypothetical protein